MTVGGAGMTAGAAAALMGDGVGGCFCGVGGATRRSSCDQLRTNGYLSGPEYRPPALSFPLLRYSRFQSDIPAHPVIPAKAGSHAPGLSLRRG